MRALSCSITVVCLLVVGCVGKTPPPDFQPADFQNLESAQKKPELVQARVETPEERKVEKEIKGLEDELIAIDRKIAACVCKTGVKTRCVPEREPFFSRFSQTPLEERETIDGRRHIAERLRQVIERYRQLLWNCQETLKLKERQDRERIIVPPVERDEENFGVMP